MVCSASVYGPSRVVLERDFSRFGVEASMVDTSDVERLRGAITERTRIVFIETPANPTLTITDLSAAAEVAHEAGALLVVDNTFMSPVLQKPFRFGADVIVHSMTKYLNGHSDVVAGVMVSREKRLHDRLAAMLAGLGGILDPHQAWLVLRGIRTLSLRLYRRALVTLSWTMRKMAFSSSGSSRGSPALQANSISGPCNTSDS